MNHFLQDNYNNDRTKITLHYRDTMVKFLSNKYKDIPLETIVEKVETIISEAINIPIVEYVDTTIVGNDTPRQCDLFSFLENNVADNIISISGSIYIKSEVKESFLRSTILTKIKERSFCKKEMFKATDPALIAMYNSKQSIIKIIMNSIIGAMKNIYSVLHDADGFNAVTSIARHCVKCGYIYVERLLSGNLYLTDIDDVIQHCISNMNVCPSNISNIMEKYEFKNINATEVSTYLKNNVLKYTRSINLNKIDEFVNTLSQDHLNYIYYSSNLKHLFQNNSKFFKSFINEMLNNDIEIDDTIDLTNTEILDEDEFLTTMLKSINCDIIGKNEDGKVYDYREAIIKNPSGMKHFISIIKHTKKHIDSISDILKCFLVLKTGFMDICKQDNMVRDCVTVSDTDSVMFSLKDMVEWYCGKVTFDDNSNKINAFVVYLISKTLENIFAIQSRNIGCAVSDQHVIGMKNEFFYPVMMMAPIKKVYSGLIGIQEGNILPKLKHDIKGLSFKSSNLSKYTINKTQEFLRLVLDNTVKYGELDAAELLGYVSDFEYEIYNSILENKLYNFLAISSVKPKDQYKNADQSIYRYHTLWQEVFSEKYGNIIIPSKVYSVPVKQKGKYLTSELFLNNLKTTNFNLYSKFVNYVQKDPRPISRFIFPLTMDIPSEIKDTIFIRGMIYNNCKPLYLVLNSLNITYEYQNSTLTKLTLVSDYYRTETNLNTTIPQ